MENYIVFDSGITTSDRIVLEDLVSDIKQFGQSRARGKNKPDGDGAATKSALATLDELNNPKSPAFQPTVFTSKDYDQLHSGRPFRNWLLQTYVGMAQSIVRFESDVVMLTHLLLYFTTTVPSALYLFFWHFTWLHGLAHFMMQISYMGTYTLMMHQHIHMRGILKKRFALFDYLFPYITDPLMGHTWNSYYHHHVKHHHAEGNGPQDLSSTIYYQRDSIRHFLLYSTRFVFFVWLDLPIYFLRKNKRILAAKTAFWELSSYTVLYVAYRLNPKPTLCVFIFPLVLLRLGLMFGNWGQHAFVDEEDPSSDYRSSITLIDTASNRHCFNDGYHTSHHLNPLRHWREHPNSFIKSKALYASQDALVFHNIDYLMITIRLLQKDYKCLARCMIPIGERQLSMSMDERIALLKRHTRKFTREEIEVKFRRQSQR
ncbi:hypothetical protein PFICI_11727 [Pestalotiopsis fici W106-1]|uniref:Fatty acid desaturase domain-containing protein n=1 Tax=Pestalotiopsis fici (strain W106-1 / CGMCC3.15140) TaxID=1229662 RepID=W3WR48_PESFW|nr:uncharacterized protein PFICI_11727 [Pestalotiopsis fici W106-1]ETS76340.1 hypothetical protein PFICI_11727 [Pestalotiopsis fici W106-1]